MKQLSRQERRRICQMTAKILIAKNAPPEDGPKQRRADEKKLAANLFKNAPLSAYEPSRIIRPEAPRLIIPTPELMRAGDLYIP